MFQTNLLYYKSVFSKSIYIKTPKLRNFFHILSSKKAFSAVSFRPACVFRVHVPSDFRLLPFLPFLTPFTFRTIHDTVIASGALTALKIKQTCRVDVCASSARQTGSCWQDEGNFRGAYRIRCIRRYSSIISCCGPRICKGGIFMQKSSNDLFSRIFESSCKGGIFMKKARTTSFQDF